MHATKIKKGKLYNKYNLRCNHCGTDIFIPFFLLKLRYFFTDVKYVSCPNCHKTTCWKIYSNIVPDHTDKKERLINKGSQWDNRIR